MSLHRHRPQPGPAHFRGNQQAKRTTTSLPRKSRRQPPLRREPDGFHPPMSHIPTGTRLQFPSQEPSSPSYLTCTPPPTRVPRARRCFLRGLRAPGTAAAKGSPQRSCSRPGATRSRGIAKPHIPTGDGVQRSLLS